MRKGQIPRSGTAKEWQPLIWLKARRPDRSPVWTVQSPLWLTVLLDRLKLWQGEAFFDQVPVGLKPFQQLERFAQGVDRLIDGRTRRFMEDDYFGSGRVEHSFL